MDFAKKRRHFGQYLRTDNPRTRLGMSIGEAWRPVCGLPLLTKWKAINGSQILTCLRASFSSLDLYAGIKVYSKFLLEISAITVTHKSTCTLTSSKLLPRVVPQWFNAGLHVYHPRWAGKFNSDKIYLIPTKIFKILQFSIRFPNNLPPQFIVKSA